MRIKNLSLPDGQYHDQLKRANGKTIDFGWRSNVVVDQCRQLLAAFMLGETVNGIQLIELGRGESEWDILPNVASDPSIDNLADLTPFSIPVVDDAMQVDFIDNTGNVISGPSQRIQVRVTLVPGSLPIASDETFPLREFALFGQLGSENFMIDYVRHPVMHIGSEDSLTRTIRLVF